MLRRAQSGHSQWIRPSSTENDQPAGLPSSGASPVVPQREQLTDMVSASHTVARVTDQRLPRYRTGDADLDTRLVELLDAVGAEEDRDQLFEILASVLRLAGDRTDRLNLKITNAALREMRYAFKVFAPLRGIPKVTVFGSARTLPADPLYAQARQLAGAIAARGWMVVTGAGAGIMQAASEGAASSTPSV